MCNTAYCIWLNLFTDGKGKLTFSKDGVPKLNSIDMCQAFKDWAMNNRRAINIVISEARC